MSRKPGQPGTRRDERGVILVLTAVTMTVLLTFTAIAVDLGYQRVARRDMQALADIVALDLVRMVDGRTVAQIEADPEWDAGLDDSVERNDDTQGHDLEVTAELGTIDEDRTFTVLTTGVPNAVRVTAGAEVDRFFKLGPGGARGVERTAIAGGNDATVDYQLGSFLAGLSGFQNGLLQRLLSQAFCPDTGSGAAPCRAALDVLSYSGLVNTRLTLGGLAAELGLGSADELLTTDVAAADLLRAAARLLPAGAPPTAALTLNGIAARLTSATKVRLGDFIDLEQGNGDNAAQASLDVLGLIVGSAFLIDGDSLVSLPGLTVGVPGIASMTVRAQVIETVQYVYGARVGDDPVTTGQIRLDVTVNVGGLNVLGLVKALNGTIGVSVVVGGASATLTQAQCGTPQRVQIAVTPQPLQLRVNQHLTVLGVNLLGIELPIASIDINDLTVGLSGTQQTGTFPYVAGFLPPVGTGSTVRLGSTRLGLANLLKPKPDDISLGILGIPLGLGGVIALVNPILLPLLEDIDDLLVEPLAKALGLNLGGGDVGAIDLHCTGNVALVG